MSQEQKNTAFYVKAEHSVSNVATFVSDNIESKLILENSNQKVSTIIGNYETENGILISKFGHYNIDTDVHFSHITLENDTVKIMSNVETMNLYSENCFLSNVEIRDGTVNINCNDYSTIQIGDNTIINDQTVQTCNIVTKTSLSIDNTLISSNDYNDKKTISINNQVGIMTDINDLSTVQGFTSTAALYVGGSDDFNGGIVSRYGINESSDISLKTEIRSIENPNEMISHIRGVYFKRTDDKSRKRHIGVIAQEVEKILPEVVSSTSGIKNVAYGNMIALLIECIKENNKDIEFLKHELANIRIN